MSKVIQWFKDSWEWIAGLVIAILGLLAFTNRSGATKKIFKAKDELHNEIEDILNEEHDKFVEEVEDITEEYDQKVENIERERDNQLSDLESEKEKRKKELMNKSLAELNDELAKL